MRARAAHDTRLRRRVESISHGLPRIGSVTDERGKTRIINWSSEPSHGRARKDRHHGRVFARHKGDPCSSVSVRDTSRTSAGRHGSFNKVFRAKSRTSAEGQAPLDESSRAIKEIRARPGQSVTRHGRARKDTDHSTGLPGQVTDERGRTGTIGRVFPRHKGDPCSSGSVRDTSRTSAGRHGSFNKVFRAKSRTSAEGQAPLDESSRAIKEIRARPGQSVTRHGRARKDTDHSTGLPGQVTDERGRTGTIGRVFPSHKGDPCSSRVSP